MRIGDENGLKLDLKLKVTIFIMTFLTRLVPETELFD